MLQKSSITKVAGVFFDEPTARHYLVEISRKARLAHTSTKRHLIELKKASVIGESIEKKGSRKFPVYTAKISEKNYREFKKLYNMIMIRDSGLISFLKDRTTPRAIVLFGSYQRGEDTEDSDIDIFIESKEKDIETNQFSRKLRRNVQLHFRKSFKTYPEELKNNILNGTVLEGYLEAF